MVKALIVTIPVGLAYGIEFKPYVSLGLTFTSSFFSLLLGVDLMSLRGIIKNVNAARYVSIGGMGILDALLLLPTISSLLTYSLALFLRSIISITLPP